MADSTTETDIGFVKVAEDGDGVIIDSQGVDLPEGDMAMYTEPDSKKVVLVIRREKSKDGTSTFTAEDNSQEGTDDPVVEKPTEEPEASNEPSTSQPAEEEVPSKKIKKARTKKENRTSVPDSDKEVRRSARERHVKKYDDYLEDDDLEEEGDGLTVAQRDELNKRIKKIGTLKTWAKKCPKLIGETAKLKRPYVSRIEYPAAHAIVQAPARESTAVKRYYLPEKEIEVLKESTHCQFLHRPQDTFGVDMASKGSCDYACSSCEFTSTRVSNMIRHQVIDCVFNKDFFSWNEDCLTEATAKRKKAPKKETVEISESTIITDDATKNEEEDPYPSQIPKKLRPDKANVSSSEDESGNEDELAEGFRKNDVVWVQLEDELRWPALVLKKKRAKNNTVRLRVYLIHNGEKETIPITKLDGFDSPQRQSYLEGGKKTAVAEEHARAAQKADKFLREKVLGLNIDPIRFFCLGETKLIEERESSSSDDDDLSEEGHSAPLWHLVEPEADSEESPEGSSTSIEQAKKAKRKRRSENDSLVEFITKGKVEPHLVGIYRGTVPSERHDQFTSNDEGLRTRLKQSSWWGPVDDQQQQETIYEYCHELVVRSCESTDEAFDTIKYAFEVFCPEAITKAISKLAIVDLEEAAKIFLKGSEVAKQLVDLQKSGGSRTNDGDDYVPEEARPENLDTGAVVKEELERLGVDSSLLSEFDK